ncbi:DUF2721 domain-containing protein [Oscillatoria sp. FACHB-1407]|uniref:DUF2721 domain-containing protein n=1 Tax=Oscillatoria sp. FACHB-1407 TaxID=2692847 RepID=UPI0016841068|nr:DUF2721 domain-containing protein [Oscillatoria sp. FACHB-1407]MBD2464324.1 DUF2721 domain-containing protein [Oscillatoria sp. FACHB-1407]
MSIEQTSQLLQLILNSVLMLTTCVVIWGVLTVRHIAIHHRLRGLNQEYFELLNHAVMLRGDRLHQIRNQLQQFRQRYQTIYLSLLTLYGAVLFLSISAFMIVLRSLLNWQWLITGSLLLFALGTGAMLVGIGLALLDFYRSRQTMVEEMSWVLGLGEDVMDLKLAKTPRTARSGTSSGAIVRKPTKTVEMVSSQR